MFPHDKMNVLSADEDDDDDDDKEEEEELLPPDVVVLAVDSTKTACMDGCEKNDKKGRSDRCELSV